MIIIIPATAMRWERTRHYTLRLIVDESAQYPGSAVQAVYLYIRTCSCLLWFILAYLIAVHQSIIQASEQHFNGKWFQMSA